MRTLIYIILIFFLLITKLSAHDYKTINPDRIGFFINEYDCIISIRIDTIVVNIDTIYYPSLNIQEIEFPYFSPYAPSWIGEKIIIQSNNYNVFFNRNNDSIKIKTDAKLGENWLCYIDKDSFKIYAEVTNFDTLSFLGIIDSVKTISFQAYDKNNDQINHTINDKKIKLSMDNGFIQILNFYLFPDLGSFYFLYDFLH